MGVLNLSADADLSEQFGGDGRSKVDLDDFCEDEKFCSNYRAAVMSYDSPTPSHHLETWAPPPQPPSMTNSQKHEEEDNNGDGELPLCAGCRLRIVDPFLLCQSDRKFHSSCLRCTECGVEFEQQLKCFEKNGRFLCKEDYLRMCPPPPLSQCSRCMNDIHHGELAITARGFVYHMDCFRCHRCGDVLQKGESFGMHGDLTFCSRHYEAIPSPMHLCREQQQQQQPPVFFPGQGHLYPPFVGHDPSGCWFPPGEFLQGPPVMSGGGGGGGFDNNNEPMLKKRRGRKKRKADSFMNGFLEGGGVGGSYPMMDSQQSKAKRARTSFKHHQLRIMKAHFQINQNPDSRELKMLSQKTGLDKKVLQVWFQNARAKWRRTKNLEGGSGGGGGQHVSSPGSCSGGGMGGMGGDGSDHGNLEMSPSSDEGSASMVPCC